MYDVVLTPLVKIALRTLDEAARRKMHSWLDHLKNLDGDSFVRKHSDRLDGVPGVNVLRTSDDTWIFYKVERKTVTVLDIAKKEAIVTSGYDPNGVNGQES